MEEKNFVFEEDEVLVDVVPYWVWYNMRKIALEEDIDKGGLFDCRLGAINIWVSPEDKPEDWVYPITRGALKYPREFLATLYAFHDGDLVRLYLVVRNYARKHYYERLFEEGRISPEEYIRLSRNAEKPTEAELEWALKKARELIRRAIEMGEDLRAYGYWRCPICGSVMKLGLLNDAIRHVMEHGIRVRGVILSSNGTFLVTERGLLKVE